MAGPPDLTRPTASTTRRNTLLVLAVAAVARLLVVWSTLAHNPTHWFFMRGMEMGLLAQSLLEGHGLSSPFGPPTGPTAFIAPVYPILVAGVFKLFGSFSLTSEVVILLAQLSLNLLTIALMMHLARRLFNEAAAVTAGILWALSLPLIYMPTIFWETSISCCLLIGMFVLALRCVRQPSRSMWIALGAYCGIAALVNPALLLSVIAVAIWIAWQTRHETKLWPLVSILVFAIVFSPWPIRNARAFHAFIPLRTTVGFELWMGNRPGATGFLDESLFPTFNQTELNDYIQHGELAYTAHKSELAKTYIAAHPAEFVTLTLRRTFRFWTGTGSRGGSPIFALYASFTTLFGFCGLWLLLRERRYAIAILFALPMLLFPLPYMITHAEFRYRIVIDPLLATLSAYAITELYRLNAAKEARKVLASPPPQAALESAS